MNAINISIGLGTVAAVVGLVFLVRWFIRSVRAQGADEQAAKHDRDALHERKEADAKMAKAREDYARQGGHKGALDRRDF